jgi:hypothetical protein
MVPWFCQPLWHRQHKCLPHAAVRIATVPVSRYALFLASAFFKGTRDGLPLAAPDSEAADLSDERERADVLG